jgi:HD superfamily phosphohydrolase
VHIRDPIHGAIEITADERAVVDSPQYQRLRNVKQLGFADLAFPGATHTRYAHGLGAMAVATRVFDLLAPKLELDGQDRARFRQVVRLAVLFHDLGHAPLSHATERIMPKAAELQLPAWLRDDDEDPARQADHEDYTLKLVLDSGLAAELTRRFGPLGISPAHIAGLISGKRPPGADPYRSGNRDYLPILRSLVSGELDADRMDYLQRDSFFTGVNYGKFDLDWLIQNVDFVERDGRIYLALLHRAVFAFEDFLLSRYHMFLSVYFHYASVGYEVLLQKYCDTNAGEYALPSDVDEYLQHDDVTLLAALRRSSNPWARRVVRRQGYRMLVEGNEVAPVLALRERLDEAGIACFDTASRGVLATYGREAPLWVKSPSRGEVPVGEYTPLYERYREPATLARLYVEPERAEEARRLLGLAPG